VVLKLFAPFCGLFGSLVLVFCATKEIIDYLRIRKVPYTNYWIKLSYISLGE